MANILTKTQLNDLFDYLDEKDAVLMCDNTLKLTKQWIQENGLSDKEDDIVKYLENRGGFCDCEVIFNVQR